MAKGRPRKKVARTAKGRISRAGRQTDVRDVALNQPHRKWLGESRRTAQEAESVIGRAYLSKLITEPELWAATKYLRLMDSFHLVMATPVTRQSAAAIGVAPGLETPAEADPPPERAETPEDRKERVLGALEGLGEAMRGCTEPKVSRAELDAVVLRDAAIGNLSALKQALVALVRHWRLDGVEAPKRPKYWRSERPEIQAEYETQEG